MSQRARHSGRGFTGRPYTRNRGNREALSVHQDTRPRRIRPNGRGFTDRPNTRNRGNLEDLSVHQFPGSQRIRQNAGTQGIFTTRRHLSNLIVSLLQPLSIVEDAGFQAFVDAIKNPGTLIPKETFSIRKDLLRMYNKTRQKVEQALALAHDIVLTAELWVARAEESYLTVTCHVIDTEWNLNSYVLETTKVLGEDTSVDIVKQLLGIANDWRIKEKIHTVVTNIDGSMREDISRNGWTHIPCFAHTLNLVFKETLMMDPVLEAMLRKCQKIVRFFHNDIEAEKKLKEAQLQQQLPHHGLIQSVGDGWFSCFHMLKRLAEQYMAINMVLSQRQEFDLCLNGSDITKAASAVAALQPFKDVTEEMSQRCKDISNNQQYYFLSNSIPLVGELQTKINKEQRGNDVANHLAKQCKHHFGDLKKSQRLVLTTALDPRFKNLILNVNDSESANHFLTKLLKDLKAISSPLIVSSDVPNLVQLLKKYSEHSSIPETENPLAWWRFEGSEKFKDLSRVALRNLGVVSTAIPLDRAFHETDKMFYSRRSCLEPENINIILFLNSNYTP
ncbi:zinc finger BED domain-containing protein 4-like [Salvelinus alpinus]|uniref:zinc finger BED domain-containing protein 4-like n=1 Tax=Salvelinus alpinus TaxID=8036 RepID=UPI0039FC0445